MSDSSSGRVDAAFFAGRFRQKKKKKTRRLQHRRPPHHHRRCWLQLFCRQVPAKNQSLEALTLKDVRLHHRRLLVCNTGALLFSHIPPCMVVAVVPRRTTRQSRPWPPPPPVSTSPATLPHRSRGEGRSRASTAAGPLAGETVMAWLTMAGEMWFRR